VDNVNVMSTTGPSDRRNQANERGTVDMANTVKSTKSTKGDLLAKGGGTKKPLSKKPGPGSGPGEPNRGDAGYWKRVANQ